MGWGIAKVMRKAVGQGEAKLGWGRKGNGMEGRREGGVGGARSGSWKKLGGSERESERGGGRMGDSKRWITSLYVSTSRPTALTQPLWSDLPITLSVTPGSKLLAWCRRDSAHLGTPERALVIQRHSSNGEGKVEPPSSREDSRSLGTDWGGVQTCQQWRAWGSEQGRLQCGDV